MHKEGYKQDPGSPHDAVHPYMKDELIRLVTLYKFDREILEIKDFLGGLRREIDEAETRLAKGKEQVEAKVKEQDLRHVESRRIDGDIADAETRYKENNYQLMKLKDSKSYEAMKYQMEELREEIGSLEARGIEVLSAIEETDAKLTDYNGKIEAEESRINGLKEKLKEEEELRAEDVEGLQKKREGYLEALSPSTISTYERLLKLPDRRALAELDGRTCTGCYSNITLDNLDKVKMMSEIVTCNDCGRIIYIPSILGSAED